MSLFYNYKNIKVHYTSTGKGSAIILLHGFLENIKMWDEIIPELSKKNRVIAIDLFGHGKTENLGYVHTMDDQALMIRALLKDLNLRKVTLIGHSMGGYIALSFADLFPKNSKGICLLNSTAYADTDEKKKNRDRVIIAVKQNYKTFIRISIPLLFSEANRDLLKKEIKTTITEALNTSKQGVIASLEGMKVRDDKTHVLQNENIKKLLILGENDPVLNFNTHIKQIKNTNTKWHKLSDGHMSHIERTVDVISNLKSFAKFDVRFNPKN